jgi:hypothetical protein
MYLIDKNLMPTAAATYKPTVAGLISWLESQAGNTSYDYHSHNDCLLCRFVSAISGRKTSWRETWDALDLYGPGNPNMTFQNIAYGSHDGIAANYTYSAALARARALQ